MPYVIKRGALSEVVVGAAGERVELHEVLKVRNFARLPLSEQSGATEVVFGRRGGEERRQRVGRVRILR